MGNSVTAAQPPPQSENASTGNLNSAEAEVARGRTPLLEVLEPLFESLIPGDSDGYVGKNLIEFIYTVALNSSVVVVFITFFIPRGSKIPSDLIRHLVSVSSSCHVKLENYLEIKCRSRFTVWLTLVRRKTFAFVEL